MLVVLGGRVDPLFSQLMRGRLLGRRRLIPLQILEHHYLVLDKVLQLAALAASHLQNLNGGFRYLRRNVKQDVIEYMRSFADLIEKS